MKRRNWFSVLIVFCSACSLQGAVLPEMLALQQRTTTRRNVIVPSPVQAAPAQQQRTPLGGLETIIGGINRPSTPSTPTAVEPEQIQVQPGAQQPGRPTQQQPAGPVVTQVQSTGQGIVLQFSNVPLVTVIETLMRELGFSYMIDPAVNGTVNLLTTKPIKREDIFATLEMILKLNNAAIVQADEIYLIVPIAEAIRIPHQILLDLKTKTEVIKPAAPGPAPPAGTQAAAGAPPPGAETAPRVISISGPGTSDEKGMITEIIPLQFIPVGDMVTLLQPFMSGGSIVLQYDSKNLLILTDFRKNIEKAKQLIDILDTRFFDINTTELIPIRFNRAPDVAADLAKVFAGGGESSGINFIPIERLNSILVVAHSKGSMDEVRKWIEKLDSASGGMNLQTFVYQVENSTAGNIAEILSQLYSDGSGLPSAATAEGQLATQQQQAQPQQRQSIRPQESMGPRRNIRGGGLGPSIEGRPISERSQAGTGSLLGGNIKIIVNEFNNSLIIQATEADYQYIERTIKQLDVMPRQVLIEAKVYSVELRDDLTFGIAAFLEARQQALASTASVSTTGTLAAATRFIIGDSREIEAKLNALRTKTNVKVLEAPRVLAIDGQEASINIGADVPVTTSSFGDPIQTGSAGAFLNQIQFRQTGTSLILNPRISASGMVTMDLAIEISTPTGGGLTPTISRNYIQTSLIVRDGHTLAIGGIISDSYNLSRTRVPLLGDLPVVGALFGSTNRNTRRTELVILITPHVIGSVPQADSVSDEFRRALKRAYSFVKEKETEEDKRIDERTRKEIQEEQRRQEKILKKKPDNSTKPQTLIIPPALEERRRWESLPLLCISRA
ncbi:MAG TPA: secretin N-terminal domain-containing protein [Acidobacteriota bacterium]|jgi:general secretion pathway protein D